MSWKERPGRVAGALIFAGIIVGILSIAPAVEGEDHLRAVYENQVHVFAAASFQTLLAPIYISFALVLYQTLKRHNEALALTIVGFRFVAGGFQLAGAMLLPLFVLLSQTHLTQTAPDNASLQTMGAALRLSRDVVNHMGVILATGLGNFALYTLWLQTRHVPRWLSLWGLAGNILLMAASYLVMFQTIEVISTEYGVMALPLVLQEAVLALWLLTRGLDHEPVDERT